MNSTDLNNNRCTLFTRLGLRLFLASVLSSCVGAFSAPTYSLEEVARHASPTDCWIVIEGNVYDITSYISQHPTSPQVLTRECGKDATMGWKTKGKANRPHSKKAEVLLKKFLKGSLQ